MADVRSMLRAERANRRITHPNASCSTDGKLQCNLCQIPVKSEAAWQAHLHSTGHTLRITRQQDAAAIRKTDQSNKKRKADTVESPRVDRKRARAGSVTEDDEEVEDEDEAPIVAERTKSGPVRPLKSSKTENGVPNKEPSSSEAGEVTQLDQPSIGAGPTAAPLELREDIDDAQLAAFERELADLAASHDQQIAQVDSGAVITAAPKTAEEIAAEAREQQSAQRLRRDEEIEAEKEDAALALQDEFAQMEELEGRVKRLRERRDALRKESSTDQDVDGVGAPAVLEDVGETVADMIAENGRAANEENEDDDDDDDDDDDEADEWNFGGP